jgi:hypothetical protein
MTAVRALSLLVPPLVLLLGSCGGDGPAPPHPQKPSELALLAAQAEAFAARCEVIVGRPWASRLEFPKRLHLRVEQARAFAKDAAAAAPEEQSTLVDRGRALVLQGRRFESALLLIERLGRPIEEVTGQQKLIEVHMKALEAQGEAPFRIRVDHLGQDANLGFRHLDDALSKIVAGAPDAETHEKIATGTMRRVLETATKLGAEVKVAATRATEAVSRQTLLAQRVTWAETVAEAAKDAVTPDARAALADARTFAAALPPRQAAVIDKLRNAQPDAVPLADALAAEVDMVLERLTRAYLDLSRKAGIGDPK